MVKLRSELARVKRRDLKGLKRIHKLGHLNCSADDLYLQSNDRGPQNGPQSQQALRGAHTKPYQVIIPHNKMATAMTNKRQRVSKSCAVSLAEGAQAERQASLSSNTPT